MLKHIYLILLFMAPWSALAEETDDATDETVAEVEEDVQEEAAPDGVNTGPRSMSGMSILGNEEAPKSLVIIPWKSSEMGDAISLSDTLKDRAQPVDKEVFLRELRFYAIRTGE